jgi:hypothetical protein
MYGLQFEWERKQIYLAKLLAYHRTGRNFRYSSIISSLRLQAERIRRFCPGSRPFLAFQNEKLLTVIHPGEGLNLESDKL